MTTESPVSASQRGGLCGGRIAAAVARGCAEKSPEERTSEFVLKVIAEFVEGLSKEEAAKATALAKRVLDEVVGFRQRAATAATFADAVEGGAAVCSALRCVKVLAKKDADALKAWAAQVEEKEK